MLMSWFQPLSVSFVCVCVCVFVCVCVCVCALCALLEWVFLFVCVRICVFISFLCKGFSWLSKINVMFRSAMLCWGNKFYAKYLCSHVIDNHSRDLQASCYIKECQLNRAKLREVKDNSFTKPTVKAWSVSTFLLTNLESRSHAAQG